MNNTNMNNNNNINQNALELAGLLSGLEPELIAEAMRPAAPAPSSRRKITRLLLLAAALLALFSLTSMAFALNTLQQQNQEFYLRLLSPDEISQLSLEPSAEAEPALDAKRLFAALKSDDVYTQYIAINRLVELYNDPQLRAQALAALEPFLNPPAGSEAAANSTGSKLTEAAAYAADILSGRLQSPRLCHMADGSVFFTLFPDYSDYGSHNQLWQLKDGRLTPYASFSEPYNYINELLPSPDGRLLAVRLCSNKSGQLVIIDPLGGFWSTELVSSARTLWPMRLGGGEGQRRLAVCRIDNETYSDAGSLQWLDNTRLQYTADLAYDDAASPEYSAIDICDRVLVTFDFAQNSYSFEDYQLNTY